ncbi:MAG: xanthine dehydrogenase family protein molybdopterin-binding subunit [Woeseiaceae bacterium]|jgi:isoquinoline 1-oxidoreductase beta subunit|nr:xanthine dehydrogenase family protein molybdopterin-binding subunit [Woeseiaceae bacterium]
MLDKIDPRFLPRPALSRRRFLEVIGLSGAGFMVGCGPAADDAAPDSTDPAAGPAAADLNHFVRIGADNTVTVIIKHLDKGQGVTTGLPTIVAEELDADWSQMRHEFAPADAARYGHGFFGPLQMTGGSSSVANSWMQLRNAAAAARAMLVGAAASRWGVPAAEISVSGGIVSHGGQSATFGELAAAAADIEPPAEPALKDPAEFTLIGTRLPRLDSAAKTDGSAQFTLDVSRPGMLTAVVARPPKFGARIASFDARKALEVPGVTDVVEIPRGIAVVASSVWSALAGRDALDVDWADDDAEQRGSSRLFADFKHAVDNEAPLTARADGDTDAAFAAAATTLRREFRLPFLAHATMEPMDCVVELSGNACDIWTGSQMQTTDQMAAAGITGLLPEQVRIHTQFAGGSFGRRAAPNSDYVAEAVMTAKAIGGRAPVKLVWTREDDMRAGFYRPMSYHVLEGAVDEAGNISAWRHRTAVQSLLAGTPFQGAIQDGVDSSSVEGARNLPYRIDNLFVGVHNMESKIPVLWWRSVGHTQNAFVTEAFIDELAVAAGRDPYEHRRELLADHPRHRAVLDLAAERSGWGEELGPNRGRGIAVHESFGTLVAEVVDVTVNGGKISVDRVVCAVDCGIAINPDVIRAQMEGGIGQALSAALREEVTLEDGRIREDNFDQYQPLRIDEMPTVEVHFVASAEPPSGVGEPGVPPLAPALVNAIAAATGKRLYRLPIGDQLES